MSLLKSLGIHVPAAVAAATLAYNGDSLELNGSIINLPASIFILSMKALLVIRGEFDQKYADVFTEMKVCILTSSIDRLDLSHPKIY